jgi:gamma-glutamyltranspeptidase / glutathione hydrolase
MESRPGPAAGSLPRVTSSSTASARLAGPAGSAAVAAGSAEVVAAATSVLVAGGTAVDAALAGGFAAAMSEPALASLGGGGFLLSASAGEAPRVLDFFVDVPGRGARAVAAHVETVVVDFARTGSAAASSEQVFHGGWGTVAVPGCLPGYLEAHRKHGCLPLAELVAPAIALARAGVQLAPGQRTFLHLVSDLLALTPESERLFAEAQRTGRFGNEAYATLLEALAAGRIVGLGDPAFADALLAGAHDGGGLLDLADLLAYRPVHRDALATDRRGARVWTNPLPSVGGSIVVQALAQLGEERADTAIHWADVAEALADATLRQRGPGQVPTGTTHVSVVDARGGFAALTTSNGSGSGTVVPGWGVPLNNMLGEEDLGPADGSTLAPGARMGSMMAPTLVDLPDGSRVALGTGGSERIRSALLDVVVRLIDDESSLIDAIDGPRVHLTGKGPIHLEPGLPDDDLMALAELARRRDWPGLEPWPARNLYFGGVHAVRRAGDGTVEAVGDARRTGAVGVVLPDGSVRTS